MGTGRADAVRTPLAHPRTAGELDRLPGAAWPILPAGDGAAVLILAESAAPHPNPYDDHAVRSEATASVAKLGRRPAALLLPPVSAGSPAVPVALHAQSGVA